MLRNRWPTSVGIAGRNQSEYVIYWEVDTKFAFLYAYFYTKALFMPLQHLIERGGCSRP
jgi:hypothetical protein